MSHLRKRARAGYQVAHRQFGTAGLILSVAALVLALAGGAIAAGGLTGKQKKEVTKIAKKYAGKAGPAGPQGNPGAAGKDGTNGTPGTNGTSPEGTPFSGSKTLGSVTCTEGGTEYKGATTNLVCNGKKGTNGTNGSPWTVGGVLPEGKTETGTWTVGKVAAGAVPAEPFAFFFEPISFPIPLKEPLGESQVHFINSAGKEVKGAGEEVTPTACLGSAEEPTAEPGHLCVYQGFTFGTLKGNSNFIFQPSAPVPGAGTTGAAAGLEATAETFAFGTWAVTAEE